jgi:hypothetical protein
VCHFTPISSLRLLGEKRRSCVHASDNATHPALVKPWMRRLDCRGARGRALDYPSGAMPILARARAARTTLPLRA